MKNNMLFISHRDNYPYTDGGKVASFFGMNVLAQKYNVFYAFLTNKIDSNSISKYEPFNVNAVPFERNTDDNYLNYPKTIFSSLSFKFNKFYCPKIMKALCSVVRDNNINIVFCSQSQVSKYGIELKKRFPNLKIYLWEHNIEYKLVKQYSHGTSNIFMKVIAFFEYLKTKIYEINSWKYFDDVFFISDSDLKIAQKYNKNFDDANVIYIPVVLPELKDGINKEEEKSFIFCSNLKPYQNQLNLKYFIKNIWTPFVKKVPDAKLYLTGNSDEYLQKRINKSLYELKELNIINLGFVDNLQQTILSKKYFVSPTMFGSGLRIKVLEALALKKVIFLTDIDYQMVDSFKDMNNVVHYTNCEDFYNKYFELEYNSELYNIIKENGYSLMKNFSQEQFLNKVINHIENQKQ